MSDKLKMVHPGEILREEFLAPLGISQYRLAADIKVPLPRINEIVKERRSITADTALRLARFFGTSEHFWLNLQARYDLELERGKLGKRLETDVLVYALRAKPVEAAAAKKTKSRPSRISSTVAKQRVARHSAKADHAPRKAR